MKRKDEYPVYYRKKSTPVRNAVMVFSVTCLIWCVAIGYGLATSHLRFYEFVTTREEVLKEQADQLAANDFGQSMDKINQRSHNK